ncbi:MAG: indole-3-glycerol phosphate synthase TrpC [Trueperaceae bacterium]
MTLPPIPQPLTQKQLESVPGVLGKICRERAHDYRNATLEDTFAVSRRPSFSEALAREGLAVIAEVKRASPSQGAIANLKPLEAARAYEKGGAAALSILTEPRHFGGELAHLEEVATHVNLPLLRKDFTVHPAQIFEAKRAGASAVLLIVAATQQYTKDYLDFSHALGLDVLVEVHDEAELDLALKAGSNIIGVNNRDLRTLDISLENAPHLIKRAKDAGFSGLLVAESGYSKPEQLQNLLGLADAVLVGTSLASSGNLTAALQHLQGV